MLGGNPQARHDDVRLNDWKDVGTPLKKGGCLRYSLFPSAKEVGLNIQWGMLAQGGYRSKCGGTTGEQMPPIARVKYVRPTTGMNNKVDVGSSYHCEAEFTKRWIVHPLNQECKQYYVTPIGGDSQARSCGEVCWLVGVCGCVLSLTLPHSAR